MDEEDAILKKAKSKSIRVHRIIGVIISSLIILLVLIGQIKNISTCPGYTGFNDLWIFALIIAHSSVFIITNINLSKYTNKSKIANTLSILLCITFAILYTIIPYIGDGNEVTYIWGNRLNDELFTLFKISAILLFITNFILIILSFNFKHLLSKKAKNDIEIILEKEESLLKEYPINKNIFKYILITIAIIALISPTIYYIIVSFQYK